MLDLKTKKQKAKILRNRKIYRDYLQMINIQGSAKTMIIAVLSKKYNVSQATLYYIIGDKTWQENENKTIIKN